MTEKPGLGNDFVKDIDEKDSKQLDKTRAKICHTVKTMSIYLLVRYITICANNIYAYML